MKPSVPLLSPSLAGELFVYGRGRVAFESCKTPQNNNKCILIGGLSDGLFPCPYTSTLFDELSSEDWSLVQPILSNSYTGFGHGRLEQDVQEIDELCAYLDAHRRGSAAANDGKFALIGHSTGCQVAVHYLKHGNFVDRFQLFALQAPVSDREHAVWEDGEKVQRLVKVARDMNDKNEMMPREAFWCPMTAQRYLDLHEFGGADDYFSSDYSDEQLTERLHHVGKNCPKNGKVLVAFSGSDEYVPPTVDSQQLTKRLVQAMNSNGGKEVAQALYLPNANHNLSSANDDDALTFCQKVVELLSSS